jgi:hypothetical protein
MSGDVLRALFGGSQQKAQSGPVDATPGDVSALRQNWGATLSSLFSQGGRPAYDGPLVAGITQPEQDVLGQLQNSGMGRQGYLESVIGGQFLPGQGGANPFLDAAIRSAQRPTLQGLEETLGRTLPGRFTQAGQLLNARGGTGVGSGGGSSAFDRAAAIATRGASDTLGDIATNISSANFEGERNRQQQAVQLGQQEVSSLVQNLQAQGLPRLIEDLGIERGLAEFQSRTQSLLQALQIATGAGGLTNIANQSTASGTSQGGAVNALIPKGLFPGSTLF